MGGGGAGGGREGGREVRLAWWYDLMLLVISIFLFIDLNFFSNDDCYMIFTIDNYFPYIIQIVHDSSCTVLDYVHDKYIYSFKN